MQQASWIRWGLGSHQTLKGFKLLDQFNRTGVAEWLLEDLPEVTLGSRFTQLLIALAFPFLLDSISQRTKALFSNLLFKLFCSVMQNFVHSFFLLERFSTSASNQGCCLRECLRGLWQGCGIVSCAAKIKLAIIFSAIKSTSSGILCWLSRMNFCRNSESWDT